MIQTGEKNLNSTDIRELRKFGLLIGSILIMIGVVPVLKGKDLNIYMIFIAIPLFLLALLMPRSLSPLYKGWMWIGKILGRINSFLILSIIFYLFVTPTGIIYRMFSVDTRKFTYKSDNNSYWIRRQKSDPKKDMKRLF